MIKSKLIKPESKVNDAIKHPQHFKAPFLDCFVCSYCGKVTHLSVIKQHYYSYIDENYKNYFVCKKR